MVTGGLPVHKNHVISCLKYEREPSSIYAVYNVIIGIIYSKIE